VDFDLLFELPVPLPWDDGLREAEAQRYANAMEQAKLADKLGFRTAWFVEHHFRDGRSHCSAPEVMLAALSGVTKDLRLGYGVALTPFGFNHPVRMAERVAASDLVSNGRIEWGTGRSTPHEQRPFGVPPEESRDQWRDGVQAVVKMWRDEPFTWDSKYFQFPQARHVLPKPFQRPHPPAWVAGTSEGSAEIAGKAGMGFLTFTVMLPLSTIARYVREYRAAIADPEPITDVINNRVSALTLVHCAETASKATENGAWDAVWWWYTSVADLIINYDFAHLDESQRQAMREELFPLVARYETGLITNDDLQEYDMLIVGDADQCIEKAKRYADAGADQLMCYCEFGNLSHESVMTNLELLGTKVIPELRNYEPDLDRYVDVDEEIAFKVLGGRVKYTPGGVSDSA
jgi:alkanesulfonate monooxygenase SsuD/methylene tetrahydromethanopterin reductase-like flavin-dependent oxidoreductase (luciferase family)